MHVARFMALVVGAGDTNSGHVRQVVDPRGLIRFIN